MPPAARVAMGPGDSTLTVMPFGPSSEASSRVAASSAALTGPMTL